MVEEVWVLGLGQSGTAAAGLLLDEGAAVTCVDRRDDAEIRALSAGLTARGARVLLGQPHDAPLPADPAPALAAVSPGIPAAGAWVRGLDAAGTRVIAELELGARRCRCPLLAVTGTNGKSTLVNLCRDALRLAGLRAAAAGNCGPPLSAAAARSGEMDWLVVEVSSFQLERIDAFRPRVGVLLNVQPDHLDRHGTLDVYRECKRSMFKNMKDAEYGIVLKKDLDAMRGAGACAWLTFGAEAADYVYAGGRVCLPGADGKAARSIDIAGTVFDNPVMGLTAAAAAAAMDACGVDAEAVAKAARAFEPLPHRMMRLGARNGVTFIDDSKGTNLAALEAAVRMCGGPVRLIAGGRLKEDGLESVKEVLAKCVRSLYLIGESAERMGRAWADALACVNAGTLRRAVEAAWRDAEPGDTVLLSPGCASFDQYRDYNQRGEEFKSCVQSITGGSE
jgi:UDP-N-acetylmuramoylalanine--D-glutamate ligase